jgi:hypothetical protein
MRARRAHEPDGGSREHDRRSAPDVLATVFDPLRRAAQTTSAGRVGKGVGLGLYIVREIVRVHRGLVEMQSFRGLTTLRIWLPADDELYSLTPRPPKPPDSQPEAC